MCSFFGCAKIMLSSKIPRKYLKIAEKYCFILIGILIEPLSAIFEANLPFCHQNAPGIAL